MIVETIDPNSGAILFKKDKEGLTLEKAVEDIEFLKKENTALKRRITMLDNKLNSLITKGDS